MVYINDWSNKNRQINETLCKQKQIELEALYSYVTNSVVRSCFTILGTAELFFINN